MSTMCGSSTPSEEMEVKDPPPSDTTMAATTSAEPSSTETPSTEISTKREGKTTATDKRKLAKEKKMNKKNR
jgi:hypothetical protein